MNAPEQPGQRFLIAVKVTAPEACMLPSGNLIGMFLLAQHFKRDLSDKGLLAGTCSGYGPLNDSVFVIQVNDVPAALNAVKAQLEYVVLINLAHIGWFDENELVWRIFYPVGGNIRFEEALNRVLKEAEHEMARLKSEIYIPKTGQ